MSILTHIAVAIVALFVGKWLGSPTTVEKEKEVHKSIVANTAEVTGSVGGGASGTARVDELIVADDPLDVAFTGASGGNATGTVDAPKEHTVYEECDG